MTPQLLKTISSLLALVGIADSAYLTAEHFAGKIPPCSVVQGCGEVLTSQYATIYGIPLALFGLIYYLAILVLTRMEGHRSLIALTALVSFGLAFSTGLVYLQLVIIGAICLFCMASAGTTALLWILSLIRINYKQA